MKFQYTQQQLAQNTELTHEDMDQVWQCRRDYNRLGFAYQVGFVRLLNRFPQQEPFELIEELLVYISIQIELPAGMIVEYQQRRQTISEHQQRIMAYLGLRRFSERDIALLEQFVFEEACRLEQTAALQARVKEFLNPQGILQPADSTLARLLGEQRQRAREYIYQHIATALPDNILGALDALLEVESGHKVSALGRLKANPRNPSPDAMLALIDKLKTIEATGILQVDLSWLSGNYQRALFHYVEKASVDRLHEVVQPRRNAILVCFLWQGFRDAIDQAVDMYDKLITCAYTKAENDLDEKMRQQRRTIRTALAALKTLGEVILDDKVTDEDLRARLFDRIPRDELAAQIEMLNEWVSGKKSHVFYGVVSRHSYLRRFTPTFLQALNFVQEIEGNNACLEALRSLNELNAAKKRKLAKDVPTEFLSKGLRPLVYDDKGRLQKPAWECALLTQLRDEIRAGNLSIQHSKRFGRFDDFFISYAHWASLREAFFQRAKLPHNPAELSGYLRLRLNAAFDQFLETAADNRYATADEKGWHLSADPTEKLDPVEQLQLDQLKDWLAQHMRLIRLPDLLIEVDNELGFTRHFMTPSQRQNLTADDT